LESHDTLTLIQAIGLYVDSTRSKAVNEAAHRELFRFVQWCGPDKPLIEINPSEIGAYADNIGGSGTSPMAAERLQVVRGFLTYAKKKGLTERNLATHVRIRKSKTRGTANGTASNPNIVELTAEGHAKLVSTLEKLKGDRGPLALQIQKAAADKDVRENAPLEAAREQLGLVESRIRDIEGELKNAVVMDGKRRGATRTVRLGAKVRVKDLSTNKETSYQLVSRTEANPMENKISDVSPIGKVLLGSSVDDEISFESPRGTMNFRVMRVSR
jgi:transcription elongation factor GreA